MTPNPTHIQFALRIPEKVQPYSKDLQRVVHIDGSTGRIMGPSPIEGCVLVSQNWKPNRKVVHWLKDLIVADEA